MKDSSNIDLGTTNAVTIDPSATPNPVMNTTRNNLTISSVSGSVIIKAKNLDYSIKIINKILRFLEN